MNTRKLLDSHGFLTSTALLGVVLASCATRRNPLEPAPAADTLPVAEDATVTEVEGAQVVARVDAWPGAPGVLDDVTPVRVEITNDSDKPLRIRYSEYALVAPDGTRYAALPPFATDGTAQLPVTYRAAGVYPGFVAAPYYVGTAPQWTNAALGPDFYPTPGYYDYYYDYWRRVELPTSEMLARALPEGVLQPGATLEGFLYFERIDADEHARVYFTADLVDHQTGEEFAEVRIPFVTTDAI